jgi:hypothetical protein
MRDKGIVLLLFSCVMSVALSARVHAGGKPQMPDPALLEYLGAFETGKGKGIDPMLLDEAEIKALPKKTKKPAGKVKPTNLRKRNQKK